MDILSLNIVYLRNVPPTPANYAQRSGRAGRSGQPVLVVTYCAAQSPHDQWFFKNAGEMVHGLVKASTLDLANRDLIENHLQVVWLANVERELDTSIAPLLDLDEEGKPLKAELWASLNDAAVRARAREQAHRVMREVESEVKGQIWFSDRYVDQVVDNAPLRFDRALDRWRKLYEATLKQMDMADSVVKSHATSHVERENARRRYGDAARQYAVLLKSGNTQNSDFYTYRYFASQGFLPGYKFPRLPLMAWIPGKGGIAGGKEDDGSMVSRPRFLALSEFGPRSLIYHERRMFRVIRAKLNVSASEHVSANSELGMLTAWICFHCGYGHMGEEAEGEPRSNVCEHCAAPLTDHDLVSKLYRIETVETVPVERISINDEERQRQGFELQTTYRFLPGPDGLIQKTEGEIMKHLRVFHPSGQPPAVQSRSRRLCRMDEEVLGTLAYAPASRL